MLLIPPTPTSQPFLLSHRSGTTLLSTPLLYLCRPHRLGRHQTPQSHQRWYWSPPPDTPSTSFSAPLPFNRYYIFYQLRYKMSRNKAPDGDHIRTEMLPLLTDPSVHSFTLFSPSAGSGVKPSLSLTTFIHIAPALTSSKVGSTHNAALLTKLWPYMIYATSINWIISKTLSWPSWI
jgi:hypothetical protein